MRNVGSTVTWTAVPVAGISWLPAFVAGALGHGLLFTAPALADSTWIDVHPLRREAMIEGRPFTYNSEGFLHRFSYRNLSSRPGPGDDGLWGTGGSISSDELYVEINGQYTLQLDNPRYGVIARMQRREDLDGRFDRQMIGVSRQFSGNWEGAFLADIAGDKGVVDFQLEANWRPSRDRFLRLAVVQPDRLYNDKSPSDNRFSGTPTTLFAHYRQPLAEHGHIETAINYTPSVEYTVRSRGYTVAADQLRLMSDINLPVSSRWYAGARLELERSTRDFSASAEGQVPGSDFSRDLQHVMLSISAPDSPWSPHVGLRYFELDEQGWFGSELATEGFHHRREIGAYAGITVRTGDNHWLEPTVFAQTVEFEREFLQRASDNRDRREFVGKIILPWRWNISRESGAVLSLNPTFRLHRLAFGGGNIQLHWPL